MVVLAPSDRVTTGALIDAVTEAVGGSSSVLDEHQRRFSWGADLPWEQMLLLTVSGRLIGTGVIEAVKALLRRRKPESSAASEQNAPEWDAAAYAAPNSAEAAWLHFSSFLKQAFGAENVRLVEARQTAEGWVMRAEASSEGLTFAGLVTRDGRLTEAKREPVVQDTRGKES